MRILLTPALLLSATLVACSDSSSTPTDTVTGAVQPSATTTPSNPLAPVAPSTPTGPPAIPDNPTTPDVPAVPDVPAAPDSPSAPVIPTAPPAIPDTPTDPASPPVSTVSSARYRLTFNAVWSSDNHPTNFPSNPHFSPLIGALHNEQVIFWEAGQLASDGIEVMAESGGTGAFQTEINDAMANGYASTLISEGGIVESPDTLTFEFDVNSDNSLITLTSMVAPSPDWFVGVHNLPLFVDGAFVENLDVDLSVYDSGTDSGVSYVSGDADTQPPAPISLLSSEPADSPFVNGQPIAGTFVFEKL